ncbi:MAG: hypothetical protein HQK78_15295, partial [Desulfobacterales bacterium]|nr:hypothetical protein [Desulfobacterales bacterium]
YLFVFIGISSEGEEKKNTLKDEKIHITADKLVTDTQSKIAEFIGHVKATQGSNVINSDRLKIYYKEKKSDTNEDSIKKIIAKGHVTIYFDDKIANSEEAEYTTEDRILLLKGPNSKVISGKNFISGDKIIFNRNDGKVFVEKGVEALIYPKDKGLN